MSRPSKIWIGVLFMGLLVGTTTLDAQQRRADATPSKTVWKSPNSGNDRILKKDGSLVLGQVMGFEDGHYLTRVGDTVIRIPVDQVRSIEEADMPPPPPAPYSEFQLSFGVSEVLESLGVRVDAEADQENIEAYGDAIGSILRGEWDFALRALDRLLDREPQWAAPQILRGIVQIERGEGGSIASAVRLESRFASDLLAQRVVAEIYRRNGFARRHVMTMERVIRASASGERLDYELAHLWWPLDASRGEELWNSYRKSDSALRRPWCREGAALRRAQLALTARDWTAAQVALDELVRRYPWMAPDSKPLRVKILRARLDSAELLGHVEEALVTVRTLREIDADRVEIWNERLEGLLGYVFQQGQRSDSVAEYRLWCVRNFHLLSTQRSEWKLRISVNYQKMALRCLASGETEDASLGFTEAWRYSDEARPDDLSTLLAAVLDRIDDELEVGRRPRAMQLARVLADAYPERADELLDGITRLYRASLGRVMTAQELDEALIEIRNTIDASRVGNTILHVRKVVVVKELDDADGAIAARAQKHLLEVAQPALRRYFPHPVGARFIYSVHDGGREIWDVIAVTPREKDITEIRFRVSIDGQESTRDEFYYINGPDLVRESPDVPPGRYSLRYPFSNNQEWTWTEGIFEFHRKVRRPDEPIHLPSGTYNDYVIVEGRNRVVTADGETPYEARFKLYYVAGLGLAKIEAEDEAISRVLIEYKAPTTDAEWWKKK